MANRVIIPRDVKSSMFDVYLSSPITGFANWFRIEYGYELYYDITSDSGGGYHYFIEIEDAMEAVEFKLRCL